MRDAGSAPILLCDIKDGIATVTLNRPEKKNAMSIELLSLVRETCESLREQKGLRAVILTGAGGVFSAGIDITMMGSMASNVDDLKARMAQTDESGANEFQSPNTCWASLPVPVIAAIDGICFGAGMQLALGADFRIAHPTTRMSIMEAKWGLIPDMGITQSLPKLMGADQAKMLMMTGRELTGEEALAVGLVTETTETPLARALELAETFVLKNPDALAASKKLVDETWSSGGKEALLLEASLQSPLMGSPNNIEMIMANMQKRAPKFG
ncbi:MAG: crotonase/enoyl-CoA hydratase family protein [Pseudomonadota bacterium]